MNTYILIYIHTNIHTYKLKYILKYIHSCMHTYIHRTTCIHTKDYMPTCIHTCIHGYIHTYIHMMHPHNIIVVSTFSAGLLPQFVCDDELGGETDAGQLSLVLHALDALTGVARIFNHRRHVRPVICSAK